MTESNHICDMALAYADSGWPVLPLHSVVNGCCTCGNPDCTSPGKHPFARLASHGLKDATTDENTIRSWFSQGKHNLGIVTGAISGLVVLDVDPRNGGLESLAELEEKHGKLPITTPRQRTGGGGFHYVFKHPGGQIKNSKSELAPGLDLKADGGYIVVAPSDHVSGGTYRWEVDPRAPLADCPGWILKPKAKTDRPARKTATGHITEGDRNDTLTSLAGSMRRRDFSPEAILAALLEENQRSCHPPLPDGEVRGIANSIGKYPSGMEWDPPAPLGHYDLPPFPLEAFPRELYALRAFCEAVAESYQVPLDLVAMLALSAGGVALAKKIKVHVQGDHREPVNLFVNVVLPPATRKSSVFKVVTEPIARFERQEVERLAPLIQKNQNHRLTLEKSLEYARRQAAQVKKPEDRRQWRARAEELVEELGQHEELTSPQLIGDDATPESVAQLLGDNGGRLALMSPEGDVFDLMAGRYSNTGTPNLGVYLKGHAGDDVRVNRMNRDRRVQFVREPALSIGVAVQPDVIRGLGGQKGFRGRGLLARFLYSLPKSLLGYRKINAQPVELAIYEAYSELILAGLRLQPARSPENEPVPHTVRVGAAAINELNQFAGAVEEGFRSNEQFASMQDWAGKLVGAVCRIAGIMHGLMHAASQDALCKPIDAETMLGAIAIGEYLIPHAKAAFFEMGADPCIDVARRILSWIQDECLSSFSKRDAFNAVRGTVHKVTEIDRPLRLLVTHGYIREKPTDREGPGRKPSPLYDVNPRWLAQNTHNTQNPAVIPNCADSAECAQGVTV